MDDTENNSNLKQKQNGSMTQELGFGLSLSGWIAFPVIIGFFLGKYIVNKFNLPEYVFYIILVVFILSSFYGLIKETIKYSKKLENQNKSN